MYDLGLDYEIICGTSVGAINAAYLARTALGQPGIAALNLQQLWQTVTTAKVRKRWFPFGKLHALWKTSVYNSAPIQKWIRDGLDVRAVQLSGRQLRIVSVAFGTGEVFVANETNQFLADWVIASSAFPVMLTPARIGGSGDLWTDGGLRSVTPLGEAFRAGAEEIDVVLCSDPFAGAGSFDTKNPHAIPDLLLRSIGIMSDEVTRTDLQLAGLKNDLSELRPEFRKVPIRIFQPTEGLPGDSLDFDQDNIQKMIQMGYATAVSIIDGLNRKVST